MSDDSENKCIIPAVIRPDATASSWEAAKSRQAATREAIARHIDRRVVNTVIDVEPTQTAESVIASNADQTNDPIATMKWRSLLLADALQRHALLKIAETGMILDEIDRAVAVTMRSHSEGD